MVTSALRSQRFLTGVTESRQGTRWCGAGSISPPPEPVRRPPAARCVAASVGPPLSGRPRISAHAIVHRLTTLIVGVRVPDEAALDPCVCSALGSLTPIYPRGGGKPAPRFTRGVGGS